jgi:hypothetical protein
MDDPGLVRGHERTGDGERNVDRFSGCHRTLADPFAQRRAVDVLRGDVLQAVLAVDVEDRDDVRVSSSFRPPSWFGRL